MSDGDSWCVMLTLPISFKCNPSKIHNKRHSSDVTLEKIYVEMRCLLDWEYVQTGGGGVGEC